MVTETYYPDMEKLAFSLVTGSRKLRPYFKAHTIQVLTNFSLKQVLRKPNSLGRMIKWAIEFSKFEIILRTRVATKGQTLVDFVAEFANIPEMEEKNGTRQTHPTGTYLLMVPLERRALGHE